MKNILSIRNLLRSRLVLGLLLAFGSVMIAVPVYAHVIYEQGHTYTSTFNCTWNYSEISHGSGGGYSKSRLKSERNRDDKICYQRLTRPTGHMRIAWDLHKWNGSNWALCTASGNYVNSTSGSALTLTRNHGSTPPCGNGVYRTLALGEVKNGSTWYGGHLSSGSTGHTLP